IWQAAIATRCAARMSTTWASDRLNVCASSGRSTYVTSDSPSCSVCAAQHDVSARRGFTADKVRSPRDVQVASDVIRYDPATVARPYNAGMDTVIHVIIYLFAALFAL